jgi:hypothetical protein
VAGIDQASSIKYFFILFSSDALPLKKLKQMGIGEKVSAMFFGIQYPKNKVVELFDCLVLNWES